MKKLSDYLPQNPNAKSDLQKQVEALLPPPKTAEELAEIKAEETEWYRGQLIRDCAEINQYLTDDGFVPFPNGVSMVLAQTLLEVYLDWLFVQAGGSTPYHGPCWKFSSQLFAIRSYKKILAKPNQSQVRETHAYS